MGEENRQRPIKLAVRVSAEEREKIEERMEQARIRNFNAYMLKMALNGYVIVLDFAELKEILRLLQIMGNNINQYAKKANETGSIYKEDIAEILENQNQLKAQMKEVVDRLLELR